MKRHDGFYVYTHARPDGSVFYVGKGHGRRAWDLAPSRRSRHHRNIVNKHGLQAILVDVIPCETEAAAFTLEREMIARLKAEGVGVLNRTEGGEGCSGRPVTQRQAAGLQNGRGKGRPLSEDARRRMLEALARGRESARAWRQSEAGKAHAQSLAQWSVAKRRLQPPRALTCVACHEPFETRSPKAYCCSKACNQRHLSAVRRQQRDEQRSAK